MKKCIHCRIVYHFDERVRCLYCDAILLTTDRDDTFKDAKMDTVGTLMRDVVRTEQKTGMAHETKRYLLGSYFRMRTFNFLYSFSRQEFKMGKEYKRRLVHPLELTSVFMIPWVILDLLDSLFFPLCYHDYCPECNFKYMKVSGTETKHNPRECDYNKEYAHLVDEVLSGNIAWTEQDFQREALRKIKEGQRSAYFDLCSRKNKHETVLDITCIWLSCGLLVLLLVTVLFPFMLKGAIALQNE